MKNEERKRNIIFIITMVLVTIYLLWRILFTIPVHEGIISLIFGILLVLAETITDLTTFDLFFQKMKMNKSRLAFPEIPHEYYPDVDILIATHNEPIEILYKTVNACTFMKYPDKNKVHIYLCDDGNRPEVLELASQFHIGYLGLADNKDAKSGNYNNALSKTVSPLIATFDADMIPQHEFLMKTVPYFFHAWYIQENDIWRLRTEEELEQAPNIGLVQTPQSFYNPDLFQFNLYAENQIPNEQDFFSKEVNIMRNSSNSVAYTGSNTVLLRSALVEINGFPTQTITEDYELSIRMQKAGYITYATDEILAAGLTTTTIKSMISQRIRWGRGIIHSLQNTHAIFTPKLSILSRIAYLSGFLYWWSFFNRLIFIISPILFALFDIQVVNCDFWDILIFWLPSYFFYSLSMRYLSSNIRNQRWSQVIDTIFMPYLIFPIFLETLHIHMKKFKVTNKKKSSPETLRGSYIYAIPHVILMLLSVASLIRFTNGKYGWSLVYSSVILFWLFYNMIALCYAMYFMLGRRTYRDSERIRAQEDIVVSYGGLSYHGKTVDVSESGVSFCINKPTYFPEHEELTFTIKTPYYESILTGKLVYVRAMENEWRYSAVVTPVDEIHKRQYMQIIYDRTHSLPTQMNLWMTAYDDMKRNAKKRLEKPVSDKRTMPRIRLDKMAAFRDGTTCYLHDFNYYYFSVSSLTLSESNKEEFDYVTESGICIHLQRTGQTIHNASQELLKVTNLDELVKKQQLGQLLEDIMNTEESEN